MLVIVLWISFENVADENDNCRSTINTYFGLDQLEYLYAWYIAFGYVTNNNGEDLPSVRSVHPDNKVKGDPESADD